jgi:hypothetical protein
MTGTVYATDAPMTDTPTTPTGENCDRCNVPNAVMAVKLASRCHAELLRTSLPRASEQAAHCFHLIIGANFSGFRGGWREWSTGYSASVA